MENKKLTRSSDKKLAGVCARIFRMGYNGDTYHLCTADCFHRILRCACLYYLVADNS